MTDMKKWEVVQLMNFHQTRDTRFDELRNEINNMAEVETMIISSFPKMVCVPMEVYEYLQRRAEEIDAGYTPEPCGRCAYYNKLLKTIEGE